MKVLLKSYDFEICSEKRKDQQKDMINFMSKQVLRNWSKASTAVVSAANKNDTLFRST